MNDTNAVKLKLEAKLNELLERASGIEQALSDPGNSDSEENAIEMENDETMLAIGAAAKAEIREIKIALHRIETGEYGTCTACGKHIPKERLALLPWTGVCASCVGVGR